MSLLQREVDEMLEVFFAASLAGYTSDTPQNKTVEERTGAKLITFAGGDFLFEDRYWVGECGSGGTMLMRRKLQPVWMMSYYGWYPKEAVPCLKKALRAAYEGKLFMGGRGPRFFEGAEGFVYRNVVRYKDFKNFAGHEYICRSDSVEIFGDHHYHGGLL